MTDWQPIETAPKDGTVVLVVGDRGHSCAQWRREGWDTGSGWHATVEGQECLDGDDRYGLKRLSPTHWMPIPSPPAGDRT